MTPLRVPVTIHKGINMTQSPPPPTVSPIPPSPANLPSGQATASLVCGIIALVLCAPIIAVPVGIVAIVIGAIARGKAKSGKASGGGKALAGIICGSTGIVLSFVITFAILLPSLQGARERARYIKWAGWSHNNRVDSRFMMYYNMENQSETEDFVRNQAAGDPFMQAKLDIEPQMMDGKFTSAATKPAWTRNGRYRGKGALQFDGVDDHVSFEIPADPFPNGFAFYMWIKSANTKGRVFARGDGSIAIDLTPSGFTVTANDVTLPVAATLNDDRFHFIAVSFDNPEGAEGTLNVYVDGMLESEGAFAGFTESKITGYLLGGDGVSGFFSGTLDEFAILHESLKNQEPANYFQAGKPYQ